MKSLALRLIVLGMGWVGAASGQLRPADVATILADANDMDSPYAFQRLQVRFETDDSIMAPTDVLRFYLGFATQPAYAPEVQTDMPLYDLYQQNKYADVARDARQLLSRNPVSLAGHLMLALSSEKLGHADQAARYGQRYGRLLKAIQASGSGRSAETALHVISAGDVVRVLSEMGLRPATRPQTIVKGDQVLEVHRVRPANSTSTFDIYFDLTLAHRDQAQEEDIRQLEALSEAPDSTGAPVPKPVQRKRRGNRN